MAKRHIKLILVKTVPASRPVHYHWQYCGDANSGSKEPGWWHFLVTIALICLREIGQSVSPRTLCTIMLGQGPSLFWHYSGGTNSPLESLQQSHYTSFTAGWKHPFLDYTLTLNGSTECTCKTLISLNTLSVVFLGGFRLPIFDDI